jgi:polysaccharide pyruvyl transferase WcaK-like protein
MIDDDMLCLLEAHQMITVRESLTMNTLKKKGLTNVLPCADSAFLLEPERFNLPDNFTDMVALNISPLLIRREPVSGMTIKAFRTLVQYILDKTEFGVSLIPHVVLPMDSDSDALSSVVEGLSDNPRIYRAPDNLNAAQYKYIISRCRFGIFARTHASIAAYSTNIPAIVVGYSVKAAGLAADLGFSKYLCPIESLTTQSVLVDYFQNLVKNEASLALLLESEMPEYKNRITSQAIMERL